MLNSNKIKEKKLNIPIYEDDQAHIYFNPIVTDDFIFKKTILKKFEEIKNKIESIYEIQENHGIFNSFYILLTKKYYINTLTSIFFILFSSLILISIHFIYPTLSASKLKIQVNENINDPSNFELNIYNLENKHLIVYFFALFVSFNFLNLTQHLILSYAMHYNSLFAYDSVKNLENHFDEDEKLILENEEENLLSGNNDNNNNNNEKEVFLIDDFINKIQKTIKLKLKKEIIFAAKIKKFIHIFCLFIVLVCIGYFIIFEKQNIYVMFFFELFMLYYCCLVYFHFTEKSTTQLRNCTTSIMYMSICFITFSHNFVSFKVSFIYMLITCFAFGLLLAVLDLVLIDHSISFKGLQKIEFSIMKKNKK